MINLYVDDVRRSPDGWILASTVSRAKEWLTAGVVEKLSLDHDMGACSACVANNTHVGDQTTPETTFVNWCRHVEDGTSLVWWMIETGYWSVEKPTVHSMNPVGRERMEGMINRYWDERTVRTI